MSTSTVLPSGTVPGTILIETPLPTLSCDSSGYLIQNTSLYSVNISTGSTTLIRSSVGNGQDAINAIGYNVFDNYLYGAIYNTASSTASLIRIAANGDSTVITTLNVTGGGVPNAGDVDENGQYWATVGGKFWVQVDLRPGSATFGTTRASGLASLLNAVADWAYVPGGGDALWGFASTTLGLNTILVRWDRSSKLWTTATDFGNIAGNNAWGAVYAGADGYLYGSENTSGQIWRFPLPANGTTPVKISNGPQSTSNDGARCVKAKGIS
ncbi:hypothetical protein F5Y19DRAFT_483129 [Xylariaceae sp. FL1651]|nr:hypothetical protein F5Y19DRAFT_483129 [Xylariaceae sp. FL1651]